MSKFETRDSRIGKREFLPHIQHLTGVRTWHEFFKRFSRVQRVSFVTGGRNVLKIHFIDGHYISLVLDSVRNAYELGVTAPDTNDFTSTFFPAEDKSDYLMYNVDPLRFMVVIKKLSRFCDFHGDSVNTQAMGRLKRTPVIPMDGYLSTTKADGYCVGCGVTRSVLPELPESRSAMGALPQTDRKAGVFGKGIIIREENRTIGIYADYDGDLFSTDFSIVKNDVSVIRVAPLLVAKWLEDIKTKWGLEPKEIVTLTDLDELETLVNAAKTDTEAPCLFLVSGMTAHKF